MTTYLADDGNNEIEMQYMISIDPDEPPCYGADGGGGVVYEECARCPAERVTDTWAQCPDTGTEGLTSVTYE